MMTAYSIYDISRTHFAAWRRCCLIDSYCFARGPYFRIENVRTFNSEDQVGFDRSVGMEEGLLKFTARYFFKCISVSLGMNVV
jgi:hypothetical protein